MSALRLLYRAPFSAWILSPFSSIGRFLGIIGGPYSSPTEAEEFGPLKSGFCVVESYRDQLYLIYTDPDSNHLAFGRWRVSEVCIYGDNRSAALKHDSLVATLQDENGLKTFLRFEHRIQKTSANDYLGTGGSKISVPEADTLRQIDLSGMQAQGEELGLTCESKETVQLSSLSSNDGQLPTHHIQFSSADDRVTLPQLIVLACTINQYLTTSHDCHSFCFVVLEMLKKLSQHPPIDARRDHWLGFPGSMIFKNVDFHNLSDSYEESWDDFAKKIDITINNPNCREALEAKRLAEEEKRRAEREKERADVQARLVKDLERRVAELQAILPQHEGIND